MVLYKFRIIIIFSLVLLLAVWWQFWLRKPAKKFQAYFSQVYKFLFMLHICNSQSSYLFEFV